MMAVTRAAVVAEARDWIGTPFREQACVKGLGVDCVQLVLGVGWATGALREDHSRAALGHFAGYSHYAGGVDEHELLRALTTILSPIDVEIIAPGDVVMLFADGSAGARRERRTHWALTGDYPGGRLSLIHCVPHRGVISHHLPDSWRERIISAFSFPGVE